MAKLIPKHKKPCNSTATRLHTTAGAEGFEPSTKVLETHVLPLHHAPKRQQK